MKDFLYFGQILTNNHKLVMISIFFFVFFKHEKDASFLFFYENILGKLLGFHCMYENKIFFCFFKRKLKKKVPEKTKYFNTKVLFYSANIQLDILQNCWTNMLENHKYFEITLGNVFGFF